MSELYHRLTAETNSMNDDEDFSDTSDGSSMYDIPDEEDFELDDEDMSDEDGSDADTSDAMSEASTVVNGEDQQNQASQSGTETEVEDEEQTNEEIVQCTP